MKQFQVELKIYKQTNKQTKSLSKIYSLIERIKEGNWQIHMSFSFKTMSGENP